MFYFRHCKLFVVSLPPSPPNIRRAIFLEQLDLYFISPQYIVKEGVCFRDGAFGKAYTLLFMVKLYLWFAPGSAATDLHFVQMTLNCTF